VRERLKTLTLRETVVIMDNEALASRLRNARSGFTV
jgi:hypothetical protein